MNKRLLYINSSLCVHADKEDLYKTQRNTLLYKTELTKSYSVHYLIRSNLTIKENYQDITIKAVHKTSLSFLMFAISYIKQNRVDYVIVHGLDYFMQAALIKRMTGVSVILQHHAETTYLRKKALLMRFCDPYISAYFFNGKDLAVRFIERGCISSSKVAEVTEGTTDLAYTFKQKNDPIKKIVFIGRLDKNKNATTLLSAIALLQKQRRDFNVDLYYSTAEMETELKTFCRINDIKDLITFKGRVPQPAIEAALNNADIFVSCSLYEGSGYALIEALACGVYPVVSDIPSFNYLLRNLEMKQLFTPLEAQTLVHCLSAALDFNSIATRSRIRSHFESIASAKAIAEQIKSHLLD